MTSEIVETLNTYITTEIFRRPNLRLGNADPLISSGLIDSFHLVDLALYVEEHYNVKIDDMELNATTFDTLDQLSELIQMKM